MAALAIEERVDEVEIKVDRLEVLFGHFMSQTGTTIARLDRTIERLDRSLAELKTEGAKDRERIDRSLAEAAEDRRQQNRKWGELSHRLGTLAEDIVAPNIPRIAKEYFGWSEVDDLMVRRYVRHKQNRSKRREFDIIAVGEGQVIVNETKLTPKVESIDDFQMALNEITGYFPEYQELKIIPIFAALHLREDLVTYLTRQGIYAMAMANDTMELLNFDQLHSNNGL